jgi:hypothetical protein
MPGRAKSDMLGVRSFMMSYSFHPDESIEASLRRIAAELLDELLAEVDDDSIPVDQRIHAARKRGKRMRGLLRLVRSGLARSTYRTENEAVRDAGRLLSDARDGQTLVAAVERLVEKPRAQANGEAVQHPPFDAVRRGLHAHRDQLTGDASDVHDRLAEYHERIAQVRRRVDQWRLKGDGAAAVRRGFRNTYAAARSAFAEACDDGSPESFHEWRRRVKDHWCHLLLIEELWPAVLASHSERLDQLAGVLGEDHDLAVLTDALRAVPDHFGGPEHIEPLIELAAKRQDRLRTKAKELGEALLEAKPKRVAKPLSALLRS